MTPRLNFVREGQGPVVVLSHALGCDLHMWDGLTERLVQDYTVLRYDHRGHGGSAAVAGPFGIEALADDVAELIQSEAGGPVHFVGLSMGGMTAQALAVRHPEQVRSIVIANSAAHYDDAARQMWAARVQTVLSQGVGAVADGAMQRWFTEAFRSGAQPGSAQLVADLRKRLSALDPRAYADACTAVSLIDFRASNPRIACPTLVIGGTLDEATPLAMSEAMAVEIPGARLRTIAASHLSAVEAPEVFAKLLREFWN
jgi:3-oxoadipate enol-lactonase